VRIGEAAHALGVSRDTIRRLERRGMITASRDWAGHRRFTEADIARLRTLLFGRNTGGEGPANGAAVTASA
jgi:excisionase family DNA binding protein